MSGAYYGNCDNCGKRVAYSDYFCGHCGTQLRPKED